MDAGHAWVLNLDADLELGARGSAYTPSARVLVAVRAWQSRLRAELLAPEDVLIDEASPPGCARGRVGRAFCMTPRARALLERAGAVAEPSPSREVLAQVNSRAFCASLGETLPGGAFVTDAATARALLERPPPPGFRAWRVKRAFGMAGRGQRVIAAGALSPHDWRFVSAALGDGVRIEPQAELVTEYAQHGLLAPDGSARFGAVVVQRCDARGAWRATERLAPAELAAFPFARALADEARRVAAALHAAGYFGPFGVDAFSYRDGSGELRFNPRSEINARYSMGFAVGLPKPLRIIGVAPPG